MLKNASDALLAHETGDRQLTVTTRTVHGRAEIRIGDNGPGIAAGDRAQIFEPLYSTKSFGVGLGLSIVQQIMTQHGGGVEVNEELETGAEFVLWIPTVHVKEGAVPA